MQRSRCKNSVWLIGASAPSAKLAGSKAGRGEEGGKEQKTSPKFKGVPHSDSTRKKKRCFSLDSLRHLTASCARLVGAPAARPVIRRLFTPHQFPTACFASLNGENGPSFIQRPPTRPRLPCPRALLSLVPFAKKNQTASVRRRDKRGGANVPTHRSRRCLHKPPHPPHSPPGV